ncbi:MAG: PHP domain-containing protein [Candidatus Dormibacteraeota bacterium]|nr:PHP domain-containing protein [Candidatus Dormibacteraeota bacterium]
MQHSAAELHLHTTCSDGDLSPEAMAGELERSGLAVAAITDHNTLAGARRVRAALAGRGPEIVSGAEIGSREGHILALFIDHDLPTGLSAAETVAAIHRAGGLAVAVHPYFPAHSVGRLARELPFDAIETFNGTPLGEPGNWLAQVRLRRSLALRVGGSDAHVAAAIGHVRTLFPGHTAADLRAALESGQVSYTVDWARHLRAGAAEVRRQARRALRHAHTAPPSPEPSPTR